MRDFERRMKGALGMGGELLHWGTWKICSDSLWIRACLSIAAPIEPRGTRCLGGRLVYLGL